MSSRCSFHRIPLQSAPIEIGSTLCCVDKEYPCRVRHLRLNQPQLHLRIPCTRILLHHLLSLTRPHLSHPSTALVNFSQPFTPRELLEAFLSLSPSLFPHLSRLPLSPRLPRPLLPTPLRPPIARGHRARQKADDQQHHSHRTNAEGRVVEARVRTRRRKRWMKRMKHRMMTNQQKETILTWKTNHTRSHSHVEPDAMTIQPLILSPLR